MRTAFFEELVGLAERDPDLMLLVGDVGFGQVNRFVERFPRRFVNCGIAEQNMTGVATGLALSGKTVFVYSIANFPTLRCLEQIRNDVCYHAANVKIVAVGGGLAYGALGMTHHAVEDLAVLRAVPNLVIAAPADPVEAAGLVRAIHRRPGPAYLRLGRGGGATVHGQDVSIELGKAIVVRDGQDATLVTTGEMLEIALGAAQRLARQGIHVAVVSMHTIQPIDQAAILESARNTGRIVTLEEHSLAGGLGSAVAEVLCDAGLLNVGLLRLGLPPRFTDRVGDQAYLRAVHGLSVEGVVTAVGDVMERTIAARGHIIPRAPQRRAG